MKYYLYWLGLKSLPKDVKDLQKFCMDLADAFGIRRTRFIDPIDLRNWLHYELTDRYFGHTVGVLISLIILPLLIWSCMELIWK